jgi:predicted helicase
VVCFVTNNGFLNGVAFDGFRKHLAQDFTHIYLLDLGGNARKGGGGSVFGIMVGVGITLLVRKRSSQQDHAPAVISYYAVDDTLSGRAKLETLAHLESYQQVAWQVLQPDKKHTWLTQGMHAEFDTFLPIGTKEAKAATGTDVAVIFKEYGRGVATSRDTWACNFQRHMLITNIQRFIETYNSEVDRWKRQSDKTTRVDDFVTYDDTKMKWSRDLKLDLQRGNDAQFAENKVRVSLYRPFCKQYLFFDRVLNEEVYVFPSIFPTSTTEDENMVICVSGIGSNKPFHCLVSNIIPCLDLLEKTQCFPYYTYDEDGDNRRENITDWALEQFRARYGEQVSKRNIFAYVYALLHHPTYRERYAENLKRDLPRIPLVDDSAAFAVLVGAGQRLIDLHLNYETAKEYPALVWVENNDIPFSWAVDKMKLSKDKTAVVVNDSLTLEGIPPEVFDYRLGNRSALEWVIDQYRVKTDKRSGIRSNPNREDEPEYIARLVARVVTVSVETMALVREIDEAVPGCPVT